MMLAHHRLAQIRYLIKLTTASWPHATKACCYGHCWLQHVACNKRSHSSQSNICMLLPQMILAFHLVTQLKVNFVQILSYFEDELSEIAIFEKKCLGKVECNKIFQLQNKHKPLCNTYQHIIAYIFVKHHPVIYLKIHSVQNIKS